MAIEEELAEAVRAWKSADARASEDFVEYLGLVDLSDQDLAMRHEEHQQAIRESFETYKRQWLDIKRSYGRIP